MSEKNTINSIGHPVKIGIVDVILSEFFDQHPNKRPVVICDENTLEHCWPKLIGSNDLLNEAELIQIGIDPKLRPEAITVDEYVRITNHLKC